MYQYPEHAWQGVVAFTGTEVCVCKQASSCSYCCSVLVALSSCTAGNMGEWYANNTERHLSLPNHLLICCRSFSIAKKSAVKSTFFAFSTLGMRCWRQPLAAGISDWQETLRVCQRVTGSPIDAPHHLYYNQTLPFHHHCFLPCRIRMMNIYCMPYHDVASNYCMAER